MREAGTPARSPAGRPEAQAVAEKRLVGWDEIGSHLGATSRSAQRWERDHGLPVHRISGHRGGRVYAYTAELNYWLEHRGESETPAVAGDNVRNHRYWPAAVGIFLASTALGMTLGLRRPQINYVTSALPERQQTIVIHGSGFGDEVAGIGIATPYLVIRNTTQGWQTETAGSSHGVTLDIAHWSEGEIDISGFAGVFGSGKWQLRPGDSLLIEVWNPQDHIGPARFSTQVLAHALQPVVPFGN